MQVRRSSHSLSQRLRTSTRRGSRSTMVTHWSMPQYIMLRLSLSESNSEAVSPCQLDLLSRGTRGTSCLRHRDPRMKVSPTTDYRRLSTMEKVLSDLRICRFVAAKLSRFRSSSARHCGYDSFTAKERCYPAGSSPRQEPSNSETASIEVWHLLRKFFMQ